MTLPSSIILPLRPETVFNDLEAVNNYLRELTVALQEMYESIASNVNGQFQADVFEQSEQWQPTLAGTTTAGSFTYGNRVGWSLRQGIMTDVWFDVSWTATGGAAGNLYLELPYLVATSDGKPFVGVCQSSALAYSGGTGIVVNGIPNTYRAEFWNVGTGFTTANQAVVGSGQLIGHLRYIGVDNEP